MKVAWTEQAFAQLDEAMTFIARARPDTAAAWLELILDAEIASLNSPIEAGSCLRRHGMTSGNSSSAHID